jgi:TetR/AcrR family transcriptional regulator
MSSDAELPSTGADAEAADGVATSSPRKRPKPGERRLQILQALATMLEQPGGERITTAALAARLEVSEAALYRHFASKAQMFEGLIEFIEQSVFTLIQQIHADEAPADDALPPTGAAQARRQIGLTLTMLLQFAEKNPGMVRVMVGDALVFENERLQLRMNQFFDKIEANLRQTLREAGSAEGASAQPTVDAQVQASLLTSFLLGRLQRFARSGFKRWPTEHLEASLARLL